ncbi:MAG: hypothetical protein KC583_12990, partial [Myxococcales bacterium]|nr:hypothetical protein [Myxococcales bacterium]
MPSEVPVRYDGAATGWQACQRLPDPAWPAQDPPVGLDFAEFAPAGDWPGMNHHSQFKCVVLSDVPDAAQPLEMTPAEADARFELNRCQAAAAPVAGDANPAEPRFTCAPLGVPPTTGTTLWAAVPYTAYPSNPLHAGYAGGCVNGCAEALRRHAADDQDLLCPGLPVNVPACVGAIDDYGTLGCLEVQCDQIDNDGDGDVDEDPPPTCLTGLVGVCATGTPRCEGTQVLCDPPPPVDEICDGLDNDCDGTTDEDTNGIPCAAASPTYGLPAEPDLLGVCRDRVTLCSDGVLDCIPNPLSLYEPVDEITCDGRDNDCDGAVDELLTGLAIPEAAGIGNFGDPCVGDPNIMGICAAQTWQCVGGATQCLPAAQPERDGCGPDAPADCYRVCDGLDNDCDGDVDEDDACLRTWSGVLRLNPISRRADAIIGGSHVTVNVEVEFGGLGSDELAVSLSAEMIEQGGDNSEAFIERNTTTRAEGVIQSVVGGSRYAETYIDVDDARDLLKQNPGSVPNPLSNPSEGRVQSVTDHPAVTYLACTGRGGDRQDYVTAEGAFTYSRAYCELHFSVDYVIVPPENPCFGEPTPEVCDGIDNNCDGMVDEQGRPVPSSLDLTFGPDTLFGAGDQLIATTFDDDGNRVERELLNGGFLQFARLPIGLFGFHDIPIGGPVRVTIPGNTLELRFVSGGPGRIQVRRITDERDNLLDVPADLENLRPGQTSMRVGFADGLGLGQVCGDTIGACELGRRVCQDGAAVCRGGVEPVAEVAACNGIDEDCDGVADEDVREPCDTTCGAGTVSCAGGPCQAACPARCGVTGYRDCAPGAQVYGACTYDFPAEVCDGEDNDCDDAV